MTRRFLPIPVIFAGAFIIALINRHHQPDRDRHASDTPHVAQAAAGDYALDVRRASWPPLSESTDSVTATQAVSTLNYYIVFDGSGSMESRQCGGGRPKIEAAVDAVKGFFAAVPAEANVGLAAFDRHTVSERVPLGTGNREALADALQKIRAGSDTPLRSAIKIGYEKLTQQARAQLGYGEYHLVVVTDGEPQPRTEDPTAIVNEILSDSPIVLHTIGFCIDSDHVLNQHNRTYYASATSPEELQKSLKAVLAEAPSFDATKFSASN